MKKLFGIGTLVISLALLVACGSKITTYTYESEAVLDIKIEKTEAYIDKLVVTFAENSLLKCSLFSFSVTSVTTIMAPATFSLSKTGFR